MNAAAAMAADGTLRSVSLVRRGASGSLRSRAARAGIDLVIDPAELEPACAGEAPRKQLLRVEPPSAARVVPAPPPVKGRAPLIVFCSGRGGVGKTALAAISAVVAASWGLSVSLLDLDLSCGNLYSCFGLPGGEDLTRLLSHGMPKGPVGAAACEGVRLSGPCDRPENAELAGPSLNGLICSQTSASDLVIADTSTTFTEATATAAQLADRLFIVSDGRPGSTAADARTGGLAVRLGIARTRIARLENRCDPRGKRRAQLHAEIGLEAARVFCAPDGGEEVAELLAAGRASQMTELGVPLADSVATMLAQVLAELGQLPEHDAAKRALEAGEPRKRSFFGRRKEARSA